LYYDQKNGNLLKLDYLFNLTPGYVYFGRRPLTKAQIEEQYSGFHLSPAAQANLRPLMDQFCLSEACLIADLLQHFENKGIAFDPSYVYSDVFKALSWVHTSGTLHRAIMQNVPKFLQRSAFLPAFLHRLRSSGKKVFLLTNSGYQFIDAGLTYLLDHDWPDYFDYVMVQSGKPDFFLSNRRPFRQIDRRTGHIRWDKVSHLERGQIYVEGNLAVRDALQICFFGIARNLIAYLLF
jgi:HAD superfamily 5'-nucleotidase-like hydrolase